MLKTTLVEYGFRLPSALDNRPLKFEEFEAKQRQTIFVSATPAKSQVDDVLSEIHIRVKLGERVLITALTKRMAEDLTDLTVCTAPPATA